ncbi:acyl-CoA ligase (AMP-forming), exosortase A system-associated [Rhodovibrio salinarum]|uniref:Acyl-CoA ligase (AMP-forming), exosortase A system-associated n=1 Tax=Rhodovibrio salinarum TaxID=1087 RepID=A0A934QGD6_9PROT|nr:acyl-CoA ligase (AMP-forming), exosortase A system-associated [Rhodovibrio salinarum]MBK1696015.1 acyl-CoA ligase (AMP-forming), exosortase A system-associated [Rhodovibrio salinarum]
MMLFQTLRAQAACRPDAPALKAGARALSYGEVAALQDGVARAFAQLGLARLDRVAVYLDKRIETVAAVFGAFAANMIAVPCNPVLKAPQIGHILRDSGARVMVTSASRLATLSADVADSAVTHVVVVDAAAPDGPAGIAVLTWADFLDAAGGGPAPAGPPVDSDPAAIFYTSGSTGKPKGVVVSHRNLAVGGASVAGYLKNNAQDRILALLPLSFDAGFSQLTTGFTAGACLVLHNFLLPADVPKVCAREGITGLTCVPPLWIQLTQVAWSEAAREQLRYFANTGGHMPRDVLAALRALFPNAAPYLMYGLTEAFRSTYLDPEEVDCRPDSIGKAIPNAEILVARPDGSLAGPGEQGELVHRGPLVALGYWNDPERTAERFKPAPGQPAELPMAEPAVWSGDLVRLDADGFLYFVGRGDEMIKTSGYRVSPTEVEEAIFASGVVAEAAAFGVPDRALGQAIVAAVVAKPDVTDAPDRVLAHCRAALPRFMVPQQIALRAGLPRSPNGKIDRKRLAQQMTEPAQEIEA